MVVEVAPVTTIFVGIGDTVISAGIALEGTIISVGSVGGVSLLMATPNVPLLLTIRNPDLPAFPLSIKPCIISILL